MAQETLRFVGFGEQNKIFFSFMLLVLKGEGQKICCHSLNKKEIHAITKEKEKQIVQHNGVLSQNYITQMLCTGLNPKPRLPLNGC
jgi:hypothetical protein